MNYRFTLRNISAIIFLLGIIIFTIMNFAVLSKGEGWGIVAVKDTNIMKNGTRMMRIWQIIADKNIIYILILGKFVFISQEPQLANN